MRKACWPPAHCMFLTTYVFLLQLSLDFDVAFCVVSVFFFVQTWLLHPRRSLCMYAYFQTTYYNTKCTRCGCNRATSQRSQLTRLAVWGQTLSKPPQQPGCDLRTVDKFWAGPPIAMQSAGRHKPGMHKATRPPSLHKLNAELSFHKCILRKTWIRSKYIQSMRPKRCALILSLVTHMLLASVCMYIHVRICWSACLTVDNSKTEKTLHM